ncbi:MAG TPA: AI-2E family transporter [Vicinamibacterales bacterium]
MTRSQISDRERLGHLVFYGAIILIGYLVFQIVRPFLVPLGWAGVLAISLQPVFREIAPRIGRSWAAAACVVMALVLLVLPVWLVVEQLVQQGAQGVQAIQSAIAGTPPERLIAAWGWLQSHLPFFDPEQLSRNLGSIAQQIGTFLASSSGKLLGGVASLIADLVLALFALFFFLRDSPAIVRVIRAILPFHEQQRDHVLRRVEDLVFASVIAGLAVAAVQGFIGGVGFWLVGVPGGVIWGVLIAFTSLIPLVGSSLVWAPVAIWLVATGEVGRGIALAAIGGGLVGLVDNVLRPILLSGRSAMNGLVTFIALLGGVSAFGLIGLVFGPVVVAVGAALLDAYLRPVPREETEPVQAGS